MRGITISAGSTFGRTALYLVVLLSAAPASAQLGFYFGGRDGVELNDEDWRLFKQAVREALEPGTPGSLAEWRNAASGFHGDVRVERAFERNGTPCRDVRFRFIRQHEQPFRLNLCKTAEGNWAIAP